MYKVSKYIVRLGVPGSVIKFCFWIPQQAGKLSDIFKEINSLSIPMKIEIY